jgi:hypothetical protein
MKYNFDDPLEYFGTNCYDYPCGSAFVGFQED